MLNKFTIGSQKLQSILITQKAIFDKAGIGYNFLRKQKFFKNIFSKTSFDNHFITCFKCNKVGHKISKYNIQRIGQILVK